MNPFPPPLLPSNPPPPLLSTEPRYVAFTESRHDVVVRAGTHSAVCAARHVDQVPPHTPAGARDGDRAAGARHREGIILVLLPCRPRRRGLSADRGKARGGITESLALLETGRVVV